MKRNIIILSVFIFQVLSGQSQMKIIDMHLHSYSPEVLAVDRIDCHGVRDVQNLETHFKETYAAMKKYNIVKGVVSGALGTVEYWKANDTDGRVIPGLHIFHPDDLNMDIIQFEELIKSGKVDVFGELGPYYSGTTLSDDIWQPYLKICEKYDIPVAVHTGGGDPGGTYSWAPKSRLALSDPFLIEDVLVKYPKLRIYIMHAGEVYHEHALRLMGYYPQLYCDLGYLLWGDPYCNRYAKEFLQNSKQAGYLNRVMFGSDQMMWPYAIEKSINFLNSLDFLTEKDKEDIFYNNAARFLKLKK